MRRASWLTASLFAVGTVLARLIDLCSSYNRPSCASWPSDDVWYNELGSLLSKDASLIATRNLSYSRECAGDDAYALAKAGNGICLQAVECANLFCNSSASEKGSEESDTKTNLPAFVLTAKTPDDISNALQFATKYMIPVSVKTTGHSFQGSSTAPNSLLIWMAHYPKVITDEKDNAGTVGHNLTDSCGTTTRTIGVGGGENWDDVLERVQEHYHLVTGGCRSVGAAGGWLQGGGLSYTSRRYGLGVDNVVQFEVVTPSGDKITADACTNVDLFWAFRGGGGGTFGVVTRVEYKVHPVQPITKFKWKFSFDRDDSSSSLGGAEHHRDLVHMWLTFWVEKSLRLSDNWAGLFRGTAIQLFCTCTYQEAMAEFGNEFMQWYHVFAQAASNVSEVSTSPPEIWGAPSWYIIRGGATAYQNPNRTVRTRGGFVESYGARLMSKDMVTNNPKYVTNLLTNLTLEGVLTRNCYFLGGTGISGVAANDTAVHPAMRKAVYHITVSTNEGLDRLRRVLPNNISGVSFNHHNTYEPDWRSALWGSNYERLLEIKDRYDPERILNCWHCVGYVGPEYPDVDGPPYAEPSCPT